MSVVITPASPPPLDSLHPASRSQSLRGDDGLWWGSVGQYLLGRRAASAEDRERLRLASGLEAALALCPRIAWVDAEAWQGQVADVLLAALVRMLESELDVRAALLATGRERIEVVLDGALAETLRDGVDANLFGRCLMLAREHVRPRGEDPQAIQCRHRDAERTGTVCVHVMARAPLPRRWFTGDGAEFHLICAQCADALPAEPALRLLCAGCRDERAGRRGPDIGEPGFPIRHGDLAFAHEPLSIEGFDPADVLALAPVATADDAWIVLDRSLRLHRLDLLRRELSPLAALPADAVDAGERLLMRASDDGTLVAVAEELGRRGVVVEADGGRVTMRLLRDDYHPDQCVFPLAFFRHHGLLRLVHGTAWNRLDVSDPVTGELLTAREPPAYESGEPLPVHYLDYFHCGLHVSPDGRRVVDNGWFWHPWGIVVAFSLDAWLAGNVWESEDGPSRTTLADRSYFWDGPLCWLDDRRVAIWGLGDDDALLVNGVVVVDAVTGEELAVLPGPSRELAAVPPHLVAWNERGTTVWDVASGARIAAEPGFVPTAQHPGTRAFVTVAPGRLVLSRLAPTAPR